MDVRSYISKLLILPKSATFVMLMMLCVNVNAAMFCPPTVYTRVVVCPPTVYVPVMVCPPTV